MCTYLFIKKWKNCANIINLWSEMIIIPKKICKFAKAILYFVFMLYCFIQNYFRIKKDIYEFTYDMLRDNF